MRIITPDSVRSDLAQDQDWAELSQQNLESLLAWSRAVNLAKSKAAQAQTKKRHQTISRKFTRLTNQLVQQKYGPIRRNKPQPRS